MTASYTPITPDLSNDGSVFPYLPGQSYLAQKSPMWSTSLATAAMGGERRRQNWSFPKWMIKVSYEVLRASVSLPELQHLIGFFNLHAGRYAEWSFYDPNDNLVTNQPFGTGDGTTKTFQLLRQGGVGAHTWLEPCRSILGTPKVSVGATDTTAFTIANRGQITFATAPAAGAVLTWSGQFMFLCRFNDDQIDPQQMMSDLWSLDGLTFMTTKR